MADQEILEILYRVKGEAELKQLEKVVKANEDAIKKLTRTASGMPSAFNPPGIEKYAQAIKQAKARMDELHSSMNKVQAGSGRAAMGLNALAQGAEDLQYSVGGAMNNIGTGHQPLRRSCRPRGGCDGCRHRHQPACQALG